MSKTACIKSVALVLAASAISLVTGCSSSSAPAMSTSGPPACASSTKNAFETYGATAFVAVNKSIFANVTSEINKNGTKNLGDAFTLIGTGKPASTADDLATFEGKLAAFLVFAYGGPDSITYTDGKTYDGSTINIKEAHTGLNITTDQYNYFVMSIVVPALTSNGVPSGDVSSCFAPVVTAPSFVADIVGQ